MTVSRSDVDRFCAALPGAEQAFPPEALDSWKVGGKMFACMAGDSADGVSVKCRDVETAAMLIDAGAARKAAYFHKSWVRLPFDATDRDDLEHRIARSYEVIVKALPKRLRPGGML